MTTARWLSAAMIFAALVTLARGARAQSRGFEVDQFDPSERGSDWFSVESLDLRGTFRPAVGVVVDAAYRPLVVFAPNGTVERSIILNQDFANAGASFVLFNRLMLGFNLPVAVFQDGSNARVDGVSYAAPTTKPTLGDLRIGVDVRLAGRAGTPFTLALGTRVFVPTGQRDAYTGDGTVRIDGRIEAAGDLGPFTYAARIGGEYRALDDALAGSALGSQVLFGAAAGFQISDHEIVFGPEIYGATILGSNAFALQSTPVDAVFGMHLRDRKNRLRLGGAVGPGLTRGFGSPQLRGMVSLEWAPEYYEAPKPLPAAMPPTDRDKDGITDPSDACPDTPGVKTDDPKTNGCPPDRDKDGVIDSDDACPDTPGIKTDDPKTNGCPSDRDKDGVIDADDACPDTPGLKTDDPKTNGCPDPDRDKDGIANETDACPDVAGPANPNPTKNGCPKAYIQEDQIKIRDQVKFANASAAIVTGKDSQDVLDAVRKILVDHPEITHVRIEGHTDNNGMASFNRILSRHRAESVMRWLVKHGVAASRLKAAGFGPDRPIDKNVTETGRRNNRRVEFHIVADPSVPAAAP